MRKPIDAAALDSATDAFYRAETPQALRAALDAARLAGPETGRFHELAFWLGLLEGREAATFEHAMLALADNGYDAIPLLLEIIPFDRLSFAQRARLTDLLGSLSRWHPHPQVRELASMRLAFLAHEDGPLVLRDALVQALPGPLQLAIVGPFDNEQGRAWDSELGPERGSELTATYPGRSGTLAWRSDPPRTPLGELDFGALMMPTTWQVAFARAELTVPNDGVWRLALTASANVKVWVDGKRVFTAVVSPNNEDGFFEVPVRLSAGRRVILIKSANTTNNVWKLNARLAPLDPAPEIPAEPFDAEQLAEWGASHLEPASRRQLVLAAHAFNTAGGEAAVNAAERALAPVPRSILGRLQHFTALWFNGDNGRASDVIAELSLEHGKQLPWLKLRYAHFQGTQNFTQQRRDLLRELTRDVPGLALAQESLAGAYTDAGWLEEAWKVREGIAARFAATPEQLEQRASLLEKLNRRTAAIRVHEEVRRRSPGRSGSLDALAYFAREAGDLGRACDLRRERLASWPTDIKAWLDLADCARRDGDMAEFERALAAVERIQPLSPEPAIRRGLAAAHEGRSADAVLHWRHALALNPDQPLLASRIDEADPQSRGAWLKDVPTLDELLYIAKNKPRVNPGPSDPKVYLRDEEVVLLGADGSTSRVVTVVVRALEQSGVDDLLTWKLRRGGTLRLLNAFSIDDRGTLTQASERDREVRFRALRVGSTVVLQYRYDASPSGFLAGYLTDHLAFQGTKSLQVSPRYVLWLAKGTPVQHAVIGKVELNKETRGAFDRLEWFGNGIRPLTTEPGMPPVEDLLAAVRLTTVPDWKTFIAWWQAILDGAFRDSPELRQLGATVGAGAASASEKLERIQEWVQEEVRYQQDYESFIAGVKPHPAPMVLERRYGDCKDKAVLFVQLARQLGLEARVALVRIRDSGAVIRTLPMQQFNHAIVYVPAQPGLDTGRFFDPTASGYDLASLPSADMGTEALIFDPRTAAFEWQTIPVARPESTRWQTLVEGRIAADGRLAGSIQFAGSGELGAWLRKLADDEGALHETLNSVTSSLLPGAELTKVQVIEAKSIRVPARVQAAISAQDAARRDGETWRVKPPIAAPLHSAIFAPASRTWPMRPSVGQITSIARLGLPPGFELAKVPPVVSAELPCMRLRSEVRLETGTVIASARLEMSCAEIPAADFQKYRAAYYEHLRATQEVLVLTRRAPTR